MRSSELEKTTVQAALTAALILAGRQRSSYTPYQPVERLHRVYLKERMQQDNDLELPMNAIIGSYELPERILFWGLARMVREDSDDINGKITLMLNNHTRLPALLETIKNILITACQII